jgi:hypothetical protein
MGLHWRDIMKNSDDLQSKHVLAWTWVVSPAPDLMALIPEDERRDLVCCYSARSPAVISARRWIGLSDLIGSACVK